LEYERGAVDEHSAGGIEEVIALPGGQGMMIER